MGACAETGMTLFGASPTYLNGQMKEGIRPNKLYDLGAMDSILLGGSPVMPEHMEWCYDNIRSDIWVTSQSGGTDVASAFVGGMPTLPGYAGEIQTRCLGVDVHAFDDDGNEIVDAVGELVVSKPMPSMPLFFWNDEGGHRYRDSYFDTYPGHWRHGDYFKVNKRGGCFILGRSDSTLNRYGVRIGTAEIYRTIEAIEGIEDSIIVNLDLPGGNFFMPLFVVLSKGQTLDDALRQKINKALKEKYSPRQSGSYYQIEAVPYTLTGKRWNPGTEDSAGCAGESGRAGMRCRTRMPSTTLSSSRRRSASIPRRPIDGDKCVCDSAKARLSSNCQKLSQTNFRAG